MKSTTYTIRRPSVFSTLSICQIFADEVLIATVSSDLIASKLLAIIMLAEVEKPIDWTESPLNAQQRAKIEEPFLDLSHIPVSEFTDLAWNR